MKKIIIWIFIIGAIIVGAYSLINFSKLIYIAITDSPKVSHIPLPEYENLFNEEARGKMALLVTTKTRNRKPTSSYIFDAQFNLFILKMRLTNDLGLTKIITYQNAPNVLSDAIYTGLPSFNFDMDIKEEKSFSASKIYFKSSGDSIKVLTKNDSLHCYYMKFKTFAINYDSETYDIKAKADRSNVPASIAFVKKGNSLYIIIMSVAKDPEEMRPDQLFNILNK